MIKITMGYDYRDKFKGLNLNRDSVEDLYSKYMENIQQFLQVSKIPYGFYTAQVFTGEGEWHDDGNPFAKSKSSLAKSLHKMGTYWPVMMHMVGQQIYVNEGGHRIAALKSINSNRQFLSINVSPEAFMKSEKTSIPMWMLWPSSDILQLLNQSASLTHLKKEGDNLYHMEVTNNYEAYQFLVLYSMFLNKIIFEAKNKIPPSPMINDPDAFQQWFTKKE